MIMMPQTTRNKRQKNFIRPNQVHPCGSWTSYLIYSEADFEDFRPAGATRCTDGGEIWHLRAKFHPHRCNDKSIGPLKLKILLIFGQNVEYKRPAGAYPCAIFTKFAEFVPRFRMR